MQFGWVFTVSRDDEMKAASAVGFRGNGMHFSEDFMANLAEQVFHRPLKLLLPAAGICEPALNGRRLLALWD